MSRLARRNFDRDLHYQIVQKLHQTLKSPQSALTITSRMLKNIRFDTLIVGIRLWLHKLSSDQSRPLIVFINPLLFFLLLANTVFYLHQQQILLKSYIGCFVRCLRELVKLALSSVVGDNPIIASTSSAFRFENHWAFHLDQYTPKVIKLYLRTNLKFFCCLLRVDASAELYRLDISFSILSTRVLNEHH